MNLGTRAATALWMAPFVDADTPAGATTVSSPAEATALVELDTRRLSDGTHTLWIEAGDSEPTDTGLPRRPTTAPVTFETANAMSFGGWEPMAETRAFFRLKAQPSSEYTLWFFDSAFPKSLDPTPLSQAAVTAQADGTIDYSDVVANIGAGEGNPMIYSFTEAPAGGGGGGSAAANPATRQALPVASFPGLTKPWVAAYTDDGAEAAEYTLAQPGGGFVGGSHARSEQIYDHDWPDHAGQKWLHDAQLMSWRLRGNPAGDDVWVQDRVVGGFIGQTWPMRTFDYVYAKTVQAVPEQRCQ